jgi:hypothetical protein
VEKVNPSGISGGEIIRLGLAFQKYNHKKQPATSFNEVAGWEF